MKRRSYLVDLQTFRITHSTLIEHYQFIEAHLEGIYAVLSGKDFLSGLQDVEKNSLRHIVKEIKKIDASVFTGEEYEQLDRVFERRNFWCHNCYYDLVFDRKTQGPKKLEDVEKMYADLREAEDLRDELFAKKKRLMDLSRGMLCAWQ